MAEFVSSGMQRSEFCQSLGLSFSTLDRHLKKRRWKRRRRSVSSAGRLVPVELDVRKSPTRQEPSCGLVVVLASGRRIEVHPEFDTNTFERLVSADLSGRRGHRHAQGVRWAVQSRPRSFVALERV